jgi:hypothetical protein
MSKTKLTIGIATHSDYDGCYFTLQSLRFQQDVRDCEFVIVDNSPNNEHGKELQALLPALAHSHPVKYVKFETSGGTTQTREAIFTHAEGDAVLVMDCHVLLRPNSIARLKQFYEQNPNTLDLFSGPMMADHLDSCMSHFEPVWRGQMWGIWAQAWRDSNGLLFVAEEHPHATRTRPDNEGRLKPVQMARFHYLNTNEPYPLDDTEWESHEAMLLAKGNYPAAWDDDAPMFETPGQGLGLFTCRKEGWLGFNPDFREFGGEEMYIHEKYRQAGRHHYCLPFLKWLHRFGRVGGFKYHNSIVNGKMRNYLLGFRELGLDPEPIRHHFVDEIGVNQADYDRVASNLQFYLPPPPTQPQAGCNGVCSGGCSQGACEPPMTSPRGLLLPPFSKRASLDTLASWVGTVPRDMNEHAALLIGFASKSETIVELTKRRESSVMLLGGHPRHLISFQSEPCELLEITKAVMLQGQETKQTSWSLHVGPIASSPPYGERADMLFIDTDHNYELKMRELAEYAPRIDKYIILRGTQSNGEVGEDGGPGLWDVMKTFLKDNPDWFVLHHSQNQYGMTVLSRLQSELPESPVRPWPKGSGPGTELKTMLKWWGFEATPDCTCTKRANRMDDEGVQWCWDHFDEIMGWLEEEAKKRQNLFVPMAARMLLRRAIKLAAKKEKLKA